MRQFFVFLILLLTTSLAVGARRSNQKPALYTPPATCGVDGSPPPMYNINDKTADNQEVKQVKRVPKKTVDAGKTGWFAGIDNGRNVDDVIGLE